MATESEVIQKIRYQVDNYDEQQEGSGELSQVEPGFQYHVRLCAPDKNCTTIAGYSITLFRRHGITNIPESLISYFKQNNLSPDIDSYKVCLN